MKNLMLILLFLIVSFQFACSMGSKHYNQPRDVGKKFFSATDKKGIFITQTCKKKDGGVCVDWERVYLDANRDDDWNFIQYSNMILVNENIFFDIAR